MGKKPPPAFNNPFQAKGKALADLVARPAPAPPPPPPKPPAPKPPDEEHLFADEMAGVVPLAEDPRGRVHPAASDAPAPSPRPSSRARDEAEAYASLADLIEGRGPFDIADTDEFIEGLAPGLDRRILKRLRKGEFALQGHLDLHGMTRDEARAAADRFIEQSRAAGKRCVLIIHGRGLNSKDQIPVLKERLKAWLERGRLARSVLAFCSARPCDGGGGAVYVLLRR